MSKIIKINFAAVTKKGDKMRIFEIANYFISRISLTPKKLQKLCYYTYVWYYCFHGEELFKNNFEAWEHGPVDPELYRRYKKYGYKTINESENIDVDETVGEFLDFILDRYGNMTAGQLEDLTHKEEPWKEARKGLLSFQRSNNKIDPNIIKSYYPKKYGDIREKEISFSEC